MRRRGDLLFIAAIVIVAVIVFWVIWGRMLAQAIFGGGS